MHTSDACLRGCFIPTRLFHNTALFQAVGGQDSSSVDIFDR